MKETKVHASTSSSHALASMAVQNNPTPEPLGPARATIPFSQPVYDTAGEVYCTFL